MKRSIINNIAIVTIFMTMICSNMIYATEFSSQDGIMEISSETSDFWGNATKWFKTAKESNDANSTSNAIGKGIVAEMEDMIMVLGTAVIVLATIFLGIKMMYGSADKKSESKEGLMNLVVACVFFFGWNSIKTLLFPGNMFILISNTDASYISPIKRIFGIGTYVAQILAVLAIVYIGIKYIFAGIEGKTDLKEKSGTFLIGIILAFCSTGFLTYLSKVINEVL